MGSISQEEENFVREALLLTGIAPRSLRVLFDREFPPPLQPFINSHKQKLEELLRKRILSSAQFGILFYPNTGTCESANLDASLMTCLLRNLSSISAPTAGFDSLPNVVDTSEGADIARIKWYRNLMAHRPQSKISVADFNQEWTEISEAIGRLGGNDLLQECILLKSKMLDQSNYEIMNEIKKSQNELAELRTEIKELQIIQVDPIPKHKRVLIRIKLELWEQQDKSYVKTKATDHVLELLNEKDVVTVTGSSGVGKSSLVQHVSLCLLKKGYDVIPIDCISKLDDYYQPDKRQLFVYDDAFGKYTINKQEVRLIEHRITEIKPLFTTGLIKLIVSCRLQISKDLMFRNLDFLCESECNLISNEFRLTTEERQEIAKMYLGDKSDTIRELVHLYDFFPFLCKLYSSSSTQNIENFFINPFLVYESELDNLKKDKGKRKFCCLALIVMFNNNLEEQWLTSPISDNVRIVIENTCYACKLNKGTSTHLLHDEIETLVDTFLKKENDIYSTIHDKIFDFLVNYFGKCLLECVLANADCELVRDRFLLNFEDGSANSPELITIIDRSQSHFLFKKMITDWLNGKIVDIFCNINMESQEFRHLFLRYVQKQKRAKQNKLAKIADACSGETALIQCCFDGDIQFIKWLIKRGADCNACRENGTSPLYISCQENRADIVELLLRSRANCNISKKDGTTPLFIACQSGFVKITRELLNYGADYSKTLIDKTSPLFIACQQGHYRVVSLLLERGADCNIESMHGMYPIHIACQEGYHNIVEMLLKIGADCNLKWNDITPLYIACKKGHSSIALLLLQNEADVNMCTDDDESPLHVACEHGHLNIVEQLLDFGADRKMLTMEGMSPVDLAIRNGHRKIVFKLNMYEVI